MHYYASFFAVVKMVRKRINRLTAAEFDLPLLAMVVLTAISATLFIYFAP